MVSKDRDADTRKRILSTAGRLFFELGFSKVTMDELAEDLGMSKKTIYKYFSGKRDLLKQVLLARVESVTRGVESISNDRELPFLEKLHHLTLHLTEAPPPVSQAFLRDMRRKAPELWQMLDERRLLTMRTAFHRLCKEGRQQGLLRNDVDPEVVILVLTTTIQRLVNPDLLSRLPYSAGQLLGEILTLFFRGMLTHEGKEKWRHGLNLRS